MDYRLRPARLADLEVLVRHRRAMWHDMGTYRGRQLAAADAPYRAWVQREWRALRLRAWVVEDAGGAVVAGGALWLQAIHPRPGTRNLVQPYLLSFYTEPAHRGKGLARGIARECIAWSREKGYPRIALHASDAGRALYEGLGFRPTAELRLDLD
ncbi:MAG TPA: GNAT family N-acetyltransferase [Candidatus Thermoplasmatota archaeon]|nr:GNAT family N-acetyltransferase [Candidatus Thermoplasmatota archaeon]